MSRDHRAKSVQKVDSLLLDESGSIQNLVKKAQIIQQLGQKLESCLDPDIRSHFVLANITADVVVLQARSSAWATRLRYYIPQILDVLNNRLGLNNIKTVRIKLAPPTVEKPAKPKRKQHISDKTASLLMQTADGISDDELRDALIRIAHNYSEKD